MLYVSLKRYLNSGYTRLPGVVVLHEKFSLVDFASQNECKINSANLEWFQSSNWIPCFYPGRATLFANPSVK